MKKLLLTTALVLSAGAATADITFNTGGYSGTIRFEEDGTHDGISCNPSTATEHYDNANTWHQGYWAKNSFADGEDVDFMDAYDGWYTNYYAGLSESSWNGWMGARVCFLANAVASQTLDSSLSDAGASQELIVELGHDLYTTGEEDWEQFLLDNGITGYVSTEVGLWNAYVDAKIAAENNELDPLAFPYTVAEWDALDTSYSHGEMLNTWSQLTDAQKQTLINQVGNDSAEEWASDVDQFVYG